jgi:Zn-dependent peptidase ImmA (M78 family)
MVNAVVIMVNKSDTLKTIAKHLQISAKRLQYNAKDIHFWPENVYLINTYNNLSKENDAIYQYFTRVSLILWINR